MTTTTVEADHAEQDTAAPVLPCDGRMACDVCGVLYTYAIVLNHPSLTPRQQLRQAASRAGWKLTFDGRDVCADDAEGDAAFLIHGWTDFWSPEKAIVPLQGPPLMNGDDQQTLTIPAAVEHDAPRIHPYAERTAR